MRLATIGRVKARTSPKGQGFVDGGVGVFPFFFGEHGTGFSQMVGSFQMIPLGRDRFIGISTGSGGGTIEIPRSVQLTEIRNLDQSNVVAETFARTNNLTLRGTGGNVLLLPPGARLGFRLEGLSPGPGTVKFSDLGRSNTVHLKLSVKPQISELIHTGIFMAASGESNHDESSLSELVKDVAKMYLNMANVSLSVGKHFRSFSGEPLTNPLVTSEKIETINAPLFSAIKDANELEAYTGSIFVCGVWNMTSIERPGVVAVLGLHSGKSDKDKVSLVQDSADEIVLAHEIGHNHGLSHDGKEAGNIMHQSHSEDNKFFDEEQINILNPLGL